MVPERVNRRAAFASKARGPTMRLELSPVAADRLLVRGSRREGARRREGRGRLSAGRSATGRDSADGDQQVSAPASEPESRLCGLSWPGVNPQIVQARIGAYGVAAMVRNDAVDGGGAPGSDLAIGARAAAGRGRSACPGRKPRIGCSRAAPHGGLARCKPDERRSCGQGVRVFNAEDFSLPHRRRTRLTNHRELMRRSSFAINKGRTQSSNAIAARRRRRCRCGRGPLPIWLPFESCLAPTANQHDRQSARRLRRRRLVACNSPR